MTTNRESLMIGMAVFLAVAGLVIWLFARRKGEGYVALPLFIGVTGLYLAGLAAIGSSRWLYIPALILVVSGQLLGMVMQRRHEARRDTAPLDADGPA